MHGAVSTVLPEHTGAASVLKPETGRRGAGGGGGAVERRRSVTLRLGVDVFLQGMRVWGHFSSMGG